MARSSDAEKLILEHLDVIKNLVPIAPEIETVGHEMVRRLRAGGKVLWMGNGGSAADSQHLAAELLGRFERERPAFASVALTTDSSVLTAIANDYDYASVFSRQVEGLCRGDDVVVGISTSGKSANVLRALDVAKRLGAYRVGFTGGTGGAMPAICDACFVVPSERTARIQEGHILIGHILCDVIERELM